jgi:hypothetical protein
VKTALFGLMRPIFSLLQFTNHLQSLLSFKGRQYEEIAASEQRSKANVYPQSVISPKFENVGTLEIINLQVSSINGCMCIGMLHIP